MNKALTRQDRTRRDSLLIAGRDVPVRLTANPRARRVILKVDPVTREVTITSPSPRGFGQALAFARKHEGWIAERLEALPEPVPFRPGAVIPVRGQPHEIIHEDGSRRRPVRAEAAAPPVPLETASLPLFAATNETPGPARLVVTGDTAHVPRRVTDWLKREARADLTDATLAHAAAFGAKPSRISIRDTASRWGSCSTTRVISYSWRLIFAPAYALDYVAAHEAAHLIEHNHGPRFWRLVETRVPDIDRAKAWLTANGAALHRYGAEAPADTATTLE